MTTVSSVAVLVDAVNGANALSIRAASAKMESSLAFAVRLMNASLSHLVSNDASDEMVRALVLEPERPRDGPHGLIEARAGQTSQTHELLLSSKTRAHRAILASLRGGPLTTLRVTSCALAWTIDLVRAVSSRTLLIFGTPNVASQDQGKGGTRERRAARERCSTDGPLALHVAPKVCENRMAAFLSRHGRSACFVARCLLA
jgi:hypothetical protein